MWLSISGVCECDARAQMRVDLRDFAVVELGRSLLGGSLSWSEFSCARSILVSMRGNTRRRGPEIVWHALVGNAHSRKPWG